MRSSSGRINLLTTFSKACLPLYPILMHSHTQSPPHIKYRHSQPASIAMADDDLFGFFNELKEVKPPVLEEYEAAPGGGGKEGQQHIGPASPPGATGKRARGKRGCKGKVPGGAVGLCDKGGQTGNPSSSSSSLSPLLTPLPLPPLLIPPPHNKQKKKTTPLKQPPTKSAPPCPLPPIPSSKKPRP